jgi:hypothetical protein
MRSWRVGAGAALLPLALVTGCSGDDSPSDSAAPSFATGDCLELVDGTDGEAGSLAQVPCEEPHAGEVVLAAAGFFAEDPQLPTEDRLQSIADTACEDAMITYSGQPSTEAGVRMSFLYPTQETWDDGDRSLTCIAVVVDPATGDIGETTGSFAAA